MDQEFGPNDEDVEGDGSQSVTPVEILGFLAHSARRHKRLGVIVGILIAVLGVAVVSVIPPKYEAHARILASQSAAIAAALSTPTRPVTANTDPFSGSSEILKQKSNLIWMTKQADLPEKWRESRSLPFKLKDGLMDLIRGPLSEESQVTGLAEMLDQQMQVYHDNSVLTIEVYWRDRDSTLKLAQLAESRFLELRKAQELAAITAAISINEDEVKRAAEGIDQALEDLIRTRQRAREASRAPATASESRTSKPVVRVAAAPASSASAAPAPDKKLAARLAEIRQQEHDLEVPWQRRQAELKFQLSDLRGTYGPEHPMVLQQEAKIKEASAVPPDLASLREHERALLQEIEQKTAEEAKPAEVASAVRSSGPSQAPAPQPQTAQSRLISADGALLIAEREDDPVVAPAKANLASAIQRYTEITKRLETSRLELTSAQVALKYLFVVVNEPERPRKPLKPNRPVLILAVLAAAIVAGLVTGAVRDFLSGKLVEPWQVRMAGLQVLGEIKVNRKAPA